MLELVCFSKVYFKKRKAGDGVFIDKIKYFKILSGR